MASVGWRMDGPQALRLGERPGRLTDATDDFAALIDAGVDGAYRLATVILGNALDAEDAVADAALDAWRSRTKLRDLDRFDAWFGRILVNACRDRLRSRRRHPVVPIAAVEPGVQRQAATSPNASTRAKR